MVAHHHQFCTETVDVPANGANKVHIERHLDLVVDYHLTKDQAAYVINLITEVRLYLYDQVHHVGYMRGTPLGVHFSAWLISEVDG